MSIKLTTVLCKIAAFYRHESRDYCQPPMKSAVKASRGCFSQKFGTSSKNTSLEEQSSMFSVKDPVCHHRRYHLGSKISSISESKLAGIERKGKKNLLFSSQIDGDHVEEIVS